MFHMTVKHKLLTGLHNEECWVSAVR